MACQDLSKGCWLDQKRPMGCIGTKALSFVESGGCRASPGSGKNARQLSPPGWATPTCSDVVGRSSFVVDSG